MTNYYDEQRQIAFRRDNYCCIVCGKPAIQTAHIIPRYKYMIEKYGNKIIDHYSNLKSVCSLECNKMIEIKTKNGESERLQIKKIFDEINKE